MEKVNISAFRLLGLIAGFFLLAGSLFAQTTQETNKKRVLTDNLINSQISRDSNPSITLNLEQVPLKEALKRIAKQAGAGLYYNSAFVPNKMVSLNLKAVPLGRVLREVLEGTSLRVITSGRNITLRKKPKPVPVQISLAPAQETISGTVTDGQSGETLPGVNILVKGTSTGTSTDAEGNFELTIESLQDTLMVSFVGYQTKEVPINGRIQIDIALQPQAIAGEEMVVVGYGAVQKRDLTGSVSSLSEEDFNTGAQANVDQLIQGRVPGVQVTQTSGAPGAGASIRIRGTNSITAGNEPLFVIDGLPGAPLNALNPGDIKSMEVLKDASATAIYGSRGANGVVLITTKKGQAGGISVGYDGYVGMQEVANKLNLLNAQQYMTFINGIREDQGQTPRFSQQEMETVGAGTNWQNEILRTAPVQNHQLSFSGGSDEGTRYYISLNHYNQDGIILSSGIKRYSARLNFNHSINKFDFGINLNTSLVQDTYVPLGTGINIGAGVIGSALQMDPVLPVRDENGNYAESQTQDLNNPVALARTTFHDRETNRTFGNAYIEYLILDNLSAKINFGSNRRVSRDDDYTTKTTKLGQLNNGSAHIGEGENSSYLAELTLNYEETLDEIHQIKALAGYTYQEFFNRGFDASADNFPTDAFRTNNLGAGDSEQYTESSYKNKHQLLSWLGRVNYRFRDKYLFTGTFRVDGSSRFGTDKKYGYFPSGALGWRISDEPFFPDMNLFSTLKLRVSYGVTGNQQIGNYNSLVLLGTAGDAIFDGGRFVSIAPIQLANPDLKWETTEQFNVGLDFGLWGDRITGTMDYFTNHTYDLLLQLPIPRTTGFNTSLQNVGDTKNNGFEFMLDSRNLVGEFAWSTTFNFSTVENQVTNLGELPFILQGGLRFLSDFTVLREGDPINSYWGYQVDGIFQSQQEVEGSAQPAASPGDLRFRDVNGDGRITTDDRTILGDPFPDFTFGLSNNFGYKGFNLDVFLEGRYGYEMLNFTRVDSETPIQSLRNRQDYVLNRWTPENPSTEHPSFVNYNAARAINSRVVENASFLRLKNVRLSYTFPPSISLGGISSLTVYASGQNLVTITDYSGFNPDVSSFGNSNLRLDYNTYPLARIYTLGINLKI